MGKGKTAWVAQGIAAPAARSVRQIIQIHSDNTVKGLRLLGVGPVAGLRNDFQLTIRHAIMQVLRILYRRKIILVATYRE